MKVRKAVITAAGRGTRQYPASTTVQKEMFPLVDVDGLTKPTLQIIVEEALDAGIDEVCIVTAPGDEEMYRQHFRGLSEDLLPAYKGKERATVTPSTPPKIGSAANRSCCCSAIMCTSRPTRPAAAAHGRL